MAYKALSDKWHADAIYAKMSPKKRLEEVLKAKVQVLESNRQFLRDAREGLVETGLTEDQWSEKFHKVSDELAAAYRELNSL